MQRLYIILQRVCNLQKNADFESLDLYIDPLTGESLGKVAPRSSIYQFATTLHRSLFLKGLGRFFVGLVSLLLCLIAISSWQTNPRWHERAGADPLYEGPGYPPHLESRVNKHGPPTAKE